MPARVQQTKICIVLIGTNEVQTISIKNKWARYLGRANFTDMSYTPFRKRLPYYV